MRSPRFRALSFFGAGNKTAKSLVLHDGVAKGEQDRLQEADERVRFEQALIPHLGAAYNLARWLTRDDHDAEDVVQEAYLRALKFFGGFHGADGRVWLLAIVRNTAYTLLQRKRAHEPATGFDENIHSRQAGAATPATLLLRKEDQQAVRQAIEELPLELREVVILREIEGLSYKEIAAIAVIPLGTVMSRLARARERLQQRLGDGGEQGIVT
jgi:RNA polymerase sigma-70 factor (ECF subfamily)